MGPRPGRGQAACRCARGTRSAGRGGRRLFAAGAGFGGCGRRSDTARHSDSKAHTAQVGVMKIGVFHQSQHAGGGAQAGQGRALFRMQGQQGRAVQ